MLILTNTTDKLEVILGTAADVDTHVSGTDMPTPITPSSNATPFRQNQSRTTAATHELCAVPAASTVRNVKTIHIFNKDTTDSTDVTIVYDQNGTDFVLHKCNLAPGEALEYVEGIGFFEVAASPAAATSGARNLLTGADQSLSTTDVYLNNSVMTMAALGTPKIYRAWCWRFIITKTAAGTAAPVLTVRTGTAGSTGDTARLTFTWGAGTAAADRAEIEIEAFLIADGASAILRGKANMTSNLATTGLSNAVKALQPADSGTFDVNAAGLLIGLSWNGGTSFSGTMEAMRAYTDPQDLAIV